MYKYHLPDTNITNNCLDIRYVCVCPCFSINNLSIIHIPLYIDITVWISVAILIFLFMIQRFGTDKVGYTFAPIICVWFACIYRRHWHLQFHQVWSNYYQGHKSKIHRSIFPKEQKRSMDRYPLVALCLP